LLTASELASYRSPAGYVTYLTAAVSCRRIDWCTCRRSRL